MNDSSGIYLEEKKKKRILATMWRKKSFTKGHIPNDSMAMFAIVRKTNEVLFRDMSTGWVIVEVAS